MFADEQVLGVSGEEAALAGPGHANHYNFELCVFGLRDSFATLHLILIEKGIIFYCLGDIFMRKTNNSAAKPKSAFNPKDYERPGVTLEEVLEIKEAFDLFDYEGVGSIDPKELQASMTALGYEARNQTLFTAIGEAQGAIDFGRFFELLTARLSGRGSKEGLKRVFALFDDEKTGFISIKNLRRVVKEVGESIDDAELQEMIERADLDNDGLISEEEFYAIMTRRSIKS